MKTFRRRIENDNWFVRVRIAKGRDIGDTMEQINRICDDLYRRGYYVCPSVTGDLENGAIITYFRRNPQRKDY